MADQPSKEFRSPRYWTLAQKLGHYTDKSSGPDACWPWIGARLSDGYGQLSWKGRMWRAHRLAWVAINGPIPTGLHILHKCDNPLCVNPAHLWKGTQADNVADMDAKGRCRRVPLHGVDNGRAKLTEADVQAIRVAAKTANQRVIAKRFGVHRHTVWRILHGKRWKHVP